MLDTYRRNELIRRSNKRRTQEDFFNNIFTSHIIARVRKGRVGLLINLNFSNLNL